MENPVSLQLTQFLLSIAWGGALGVLYELGGAMRMMGRFWLTALADALFWLLTGLFTVLFFLVVNGGAPWGYMLTAMVGGALLVRLSLGSLADLLNRRAAAYLRRKKRERKAKKFKKPLPFSEELEYNG